MYLKGPAKTLINKYLSESAMENYHTFMLILRKHTIPSTTKDSLWKKWENISLFKDGASKGVHTYTRELDELQTKLTDKDGEQIITEQGKIRKFINSIPSEVQAKVKGETNEEMTFEQVVKIAEKHESIIKATTPRIITKKPKKEIKPFVKFIHYKPPVAQHRPMNKPTSKPRTRTVNPSNLEH